MNKGYLRFSEEFNREMPVKSLKRHYGEKGRIYHSIYLDLIARAAERHGIIIVKNTENPARELLTLIDGDSSEEAMVAEALEKMQEVGLVYIRKDEKGMLVCFPLCLVYA